MPAKRGSNGRIATAAIDYITATSEIISGENPLVGLGEVIVNVARRDGNRRKAWGSHGYVGYTCGGVSLGTRDDGAILCVSGGRASSVGRAIILVASNVSRIDLQCTVRFDRDRAALDKQHEREFRAYKRAGGLTRTARAIDGIGGGNTLVIGSRSSNYHGRVYDKWRESKDDAYRNCWRYEVECKGDGAHAAAKMVAESEDMEASISASVRSWFIGRGIDPRFTAEPGQRLGSVARGPSDAEEALRYLYRQVTPLVRRLEEWYSESELDDVLHGRLTSEQVIAAGRGGDRQDLELVDYDKWSVEQRRGIRCAI